MSCSFGGGVSLISRCGVDVDGVSFSVWSASCTAMMYFVPLLSCPDDGGWRVCYLPAEVAISSITPCCIDAYEVRVFLVGLWDV